MLRDALVAVNAVVRAPDRPVEDETPRPLRMRDAERHRRRTPHARTHDVRAIDAQMIEQPLRLRDVVRPRDVLDTSAGLAALAPVVDDAGEVLRKMIEQLEPGVDALRAPLLHGRVEAAR